MGKAVNQQLPIVQQQQQHRHSSRTFLCQRCAVGVSRFFSFKCALVLMLSLAAFFSALFWVLPFRYKHPGFDAKTSIKLSGCGIMTIESIAEIYEYDQGVPNLMILMP